MTDKAEIGASTGKQGNEGCKQTWTNTLEYHQRQHLDLKYYVVWCSAVCLLYRSGCATGGCSQRGMRKEQRRGSCSELAIGAEQQSWKAWIHTAKGWVPWITSYSAVLTVITITSSAEPTLLLMQVVHAVRSTQGLLLAQLHYRFSQ